MFDNMNEKQIRDRIRFLSDRIEEIWTKLGPDLQEIDELRLEFEQLYTELDNRGLLDAPQSRESIREDAGQ